MTRLPIRGIGVIAPGAIGIEAFRALLREGRSAVLPIERFDTTSLRSHRAALVSGFQPKEFIAPMKLRRMNTLSRLAVASARLAVEDSGLSFEGSRVGVAFGTSFGPVQTSVDYMEEYVAKGAALAPPQLFAESVANAPASHIAIEWKLRGFNVTITQRESSAMAAAMYASTQLLKKNADAALVGGVEEINEMIFSVLDRVGALAHDVDGVPEGLYPFDRRRNGIAVGEGSAVLIIGSEGAKTYGYLSGFGIARDATASISDWGHDPEAVARAMRAAIDDAGLSPDAIDAVYASANSSVRGDRVEMRALPLVFGGRRVPIVASKGYFGEYAAGGALPLIAALLAMQDGLLHRSVGYESPEESADLDVVTEPRAGEFRHILINSLSAGGGVVSAVVSREAN